MIRRNNNSDPMQLSLWHKFEELTDSQILSDITKKNEILDDESFGSYRMQQIFNRLTPHTRRVAECVIELYKRKDLNKNRRDKVRSSQSVYDLMRPIVGDLEHEEFWIVGMNNNSRVIATKRISIGGIDATPADVRIIFRELIQMSATAVICVHNHPSGSLIPSKPDKDLTAKIAQAGCIMSVKLLDHVIITADGYFSFNDEGLL